MSNLSNTYSTISTCIFTLKNFSRFFFYLVKKRNSVRFIYLIYLNVNYMFEDKFYFSFVFKCKEIFIKIILQNLGFNFELKRFIISIHLYTYRDINYTYLLSIILFKIVIIYFHTAF
jgi:hypothetical protein